MLSPRRYKIGPTEKSMAIKSDELTREGLGEGGVASRAGVGLDDAVRPGTALGDQSIDLRVDGAQWHQFEDHSADDLKIV